VPHDQQSYDLETKVSGL